MIKKNAFACLIVSLLVLPGCGSAQAELANESEAVCNSESCKEADLNAPLPGHEGEADERPIVADAYKIYDVPAFDSSWGLRKELWDKATEFYVSQQSRIANSRYLVIIDMAMHSNERRFFLMDLSTGKVDRHNVAHGEGSDPDKDGMATAFSNVEDSHQTSLGFYLTLGTYSGKNGYSMRIRGLEPTNDNAEKRSVVVHPGKYVKDGKKAGLSWGCPAVDRSVSKSIINKIKGGSLLFISN